MMKQTSIKSCFLFSCFVLVIFFIILSAPGIYAQSEEGKQIQNQVWIENCALRNKYWNELIFTATQTEDGVFWVAEDRTAYIAVFEGLILDEEAKMKSRRDKIITLITKAPGENSVVISAELNREVDKLWEGIINKAQSLGIPCK